MREPAPDEDRLRPLPLIGIALGSLVAGFSIVYALGQSAADAPRARQTARPAARARPAPQKAATAPGAPASAPPAPSLAASPPAPAPAPPGVAEGGPTLGQAFYFRCWEAGRDEPVEGECDRLVALEDRVRDQLPEIATCASGSQGVLSIGVEVQFGSRRTRWWSGRSTTITPAEPVIQCVRTRLEDTSLEGIEHRYQKYTIFLPVTLR